MLGFECLRALVLHGTALLDESSLSLSEHQAATTANHHCCRQDSIHAGLLGVVKTRPGGQKVGKARGQPY
ncbi:hypothetical protein PPTG_24967 [Phytophthora nicotianae INRA-310]|uniref:Uncharacterized protein n=1 Tax=Phytophthora nicotianae (strain INRA-310) TaxID=761204 RepID=W2P8S3_PHYN3|nr:hypothetical protein PPTG_24967 [Phytophthora nicotianae INRA-310]ETM97407.1 hypothetical protein PPTG_24967 [Phytophthora nicotianae INRA-310]